MPMFRYLCEKCGEESELIVPRYDAPAVCPACGAKEMKKLPSLFAVGGKRGPASCAMRRDCPGAGEAGCGCGCGCGGHHHH